MKNKNAAFLTQAAMIAAVYVVLTLLFRPISFGEIQVRIAEALTILPLFTPAAVPGVFVGCLIANIIGGGILPDIIFGSLATLIGAVLTYRLKDSNPILGPVPPIVSNTIIVPFVLFYGYGVNLPIPFMMLTVGIGEVLSCAGINIRYIFYMYVKRGILMFYTVSYASFLIHYIAISLRYISMSALLRHSFQFLL